VGESREDCSLGVHSHPRVPIFPIHNFAMTATITRTTRMAEQVKRTISLEATQRSHPGARLGT
jgi:hypothetical protein